MQIQSSIARAAQHDSEDMKFLAVMGSIFLPASLVAVSHTPLRVRNSVAAERL